MTGLTAATTYQVTLTGQCTSGGATPSAGLSFTTPSGYCTAGLGGSCSSNAITAFTILNTTLDNAYQIPVCDDGRSSGGGTLQAYSYYAPTRPSNTATLQAGGTYQMSVVTDGSSSVSVWLDSNHNGAFDVSEFTQLSTYTQNGQASVATLNVPATAVSGPTGLRVRSFNAGNPNGAGGAPCVYSITGEVEDYTVTIALPTGTQASDQANQTETYPNPVADLLTIAYAKPANSLSAGQLHVRNVLGQEVWTQQVPAGTQNKVEVSVKSWASGLYSYYIIWPDYTTDAKKFIVAP
ncbi:GEVED domain-containing protein [Hymenobacter negativus]|uniref:T9SS type A sorting domain-containing protein n=1 Tax=Hymenobacter negativus TaxID=2795026 RepID=A0ABS3QL80_9BACT|nr:GEVED domain-containing protein [Hymenobacter negativus]MBO2012020.1 T9SS type A sorting domain-containing protein [Hymenobacter negativus]